MREELKQITKNLKKHLSAIEEDDLIINTAAAPKTQKAAVAASRHPNAQPEIKEPETMPEDKENNLADIAAQIASCKRCALGETRIKAVPGEGNINAKLMFIGEGPGYDEDRQGRPFVGKAGQLLDKIIAAMGFKREDVFIANMVKCHPMIDPGDPEKRGNDRAPSPGEIAVCRKYIERQINLISPDYIVALGGVAAKSLIMDTPSLANIRGKIYDLELSTVTLQKPVKILATYHPAALLRNPGWKKDAWNDLKVLLADMGVEPPAQGG
jgi:DNA polymerase